LTEWLYGRCFIRASVSAQTQETRMTHATPTPIFQSIFRALSRQKIRARVT
jgi:hypothetical protein